MPYIHLRIRFIRKIQDLLSIYASKIKRERYKEKYVNNHKQYFKFNVIFNLFSFRLNVLRNAHDIAFTLAAFY